MRFKRSKRQALQRHGPDDACHRDPVIPLKCLDDGFGLVAVKTVCLQGVTDLPQLDLQGEDVRSPRAEGQVAFAQLPLTHIAVGLGGGPMQALRVRESIKVPIKTAITMNGRFMRFGRSPYGKAKLVTPGTAGQSGGHESREVELK